MEELLKEDATIKSIEMADVIFKNQGSLNLSRTLSRSVVQKKVNSLAGPLRAGVRKKSD